MDEYQQAVLPNLTKRAKFFPFTTIKGIRKLLKAGNKPGQNLLGRNFCVSAHITQAKVNTDGCLNVVASFLDMLCVLCTAFVV